MSKFDEWFESQKRILYSEDDKWIAKKGWEARQKEIDELQAMYEKQGLYAFELQKRIEVLKDVVEWHIEDYSLRDPRIKSIEDAYHLGWYEAILLIKEYLDKE